MLLSMILLNSWSKLLHVSLARPAEALTPIGQPLVWRYTLLAKVYRWVVNRALTPILTASANSCFCSVAVYVSGDRVNRHWL